MLTILYEDDEILVVEKPAGMESQSSRRLEPDMVSEIKKYRSRCSAGQLSTNSSTNTSTRDGENYVGVIHRLDKPVGGVMVYAKTREAAASLSRQVQDGRMKKVYRAVVCGKPVDNVGNYVDYLLRNGKTNCSMIVDKREKEARRAELCYRVLEVQTIEEEFPLSLVEVELLTGRHHQIRVQFAAHGTPLWGDAKYNPQWGGTLPLGQYNPQWGGTLPQGQYNPQWGGTLPQGQCNPRRGGTLPQGQMNRHGGDGGEAAAGPVRRSGSLALAAVRLSLIHPVSRKRMEFSMEPKNTVFKKFNS